MKRGARKAVIAIEVHIVNKNGGLEIVNNSIEISAKTETIRFDRIQRSTLIKPSL